MIRKFFTLFFVAAFATLLYVNNRDTDAFYWWIATFSPAPWFCWWIAILATVVGFLATLMPPARTRLAAGGAFAALAILAILAPSASAGESQEYKHRISVPDRIALPFLALRDRYEERRYPGVIGTYRYQISDTDGRTPRRKRTIAYRQARARAFAAMDGGNISDVQTAIGQMQDESEKARR